MRFLASLMIFPVASVEVDVVIIGGGASGLSAAKALVEARPDLNIHVLEQRNRVGGRTKNVDVPGYPGVFVEAGGTWIGPTQDHVLNLTKELGLELYHTYYNYPGQDPDTLMPQVYPEPSDETQVILDKIEAIAKDVGTQAPWSHEKAAEYDAMTLGDWVKEQGASRIVISELTGLLSIPLNAHSLDDFSFLFYLFFSASCPFRYDSGLYGGAQDFRYVRGSQTLSEELLVLVQNAGVQVHFNTTVQHVSIGRDGVTISTAQGEVLTKHAIVALGTGDARRLQYSGLTPEREFLHENWVNGEGLKFFFVFDEAFWRKEGIEVPFEEGFFFDYTPFNKTSPGIIAGFFDNSLGQIGRRALLEAILATQLGLRTPFLVKDYFEQHWDLKTEGGTANIVQYLGKGVMTKVGDSWRKPIGRLHWAGSDTAEKWMGYIDGAISSGKRAAAEVVSDFSRVAAQYV